LGVCLKRQINYHFLKKQHVGLECAIWYWHFVDVIWLFLFIVVYIWGG
jgi:cytochrome c oxidase subunit 3